MATKTFEELKQMAIQIRDEKANKQNTATRIGTQMLEHLNKLEQEYYDKTTLDKRVTELNISELFPTDGVDGSNKYTLAGAIAQVPAEYHESFGFILTFLDNAGFTQNYIWLGNHPSAFNNVMYWQRLETYRLDDSWGYSLKGAFLQSDGRMVISQAGAFLNLEIEQNDTLQIENCRNIGGASILFYAENGSLISTLDAEHNITLNSENIPLNSKKLGINFFWNDGYLSVIKNGKPLTLMTEINLIKKDIEKVKSDITAKVKYYKQFIYKYDISLLYPTEGYNNSNIYDLEKALTKLTDFASEIKNGTEIEFFIFNSVKKKYVYGGATSSAYTDKNYWIELTEDSLRNYYSLNGFIQGDGTLALADIGYGYYILPAKSTDKITIENVITFGDTPGIAFYQNGKLLSKLLESGTVILDGRIPEDANLIGFNFSKDILPSVYKNGIPMTLLSISKAINNKIDEAPSDGELYGRRNKQWEKIKTGEGSSYGWMNDKNMYSLCDSLGTSGSWQSRIAELTGAKFDKELNYNSDNSIAFSVGGTQTAGGENSGFERAMRLKRYADEGNSVDIILIENINDMGKINGASDLDDLQKHITEDEPYFEEQYFTYEDKVFDTYDQGWQFFRDNMSTVLAGKEPKRGTIVGLQYIGGASTHNIKILNKATSDGQFTLKVGGKSYSINVTTSMEISDIVNKILEWDYTGPNYTDTLGEDGVSVNFVAQQGDTTLEFTDTDTTGVKVEIKVTGGSIYTSTWSYNKIDLSDWLEWTAWGIAWNNASPVRCYKGLLEYLCNNFPKAKIFFFIPSRFELDFDNTPFKRADGTFDIDAYKKSDNYIRYEVLTKIQKAVCEYYNIPYIDIHGKSGLNINNVYPNYFVSNNVHPTDYCYKEWGEQAVKYMQ